MSEIAGDAFFWIYSSTLSWRSTTTPLYGRGTPYPYPPTTASQLQNVK